MKLLVFDVDGTLVDKTAILSQENIEAINERLAMGDVIAIASGRPFPGINRFLSQFKAGKKFAIGGNGATVYDEKGTILRFDGIDGEEYYRFYDRHRDYAERGLPIYCYTGENLGYLDYNDQVAWEIKVNNFPGRNLHELPLKNGELLQKFMIHGTPKDIEEFPLSDEDKRFHIMRTEPYYLEFVKPGVDKSEGVEFLRLKFGLEKEDVYCFGDQNNDYLMIKNYQGVAMENAIDVCKEAASFITKSASESGVAYALRNFVK